MDSIVFGINENFACFFQVCFFSTVESIVHVRQQAGSVRIGNVLPDAIFEDVDFFFETFLFHRKVLVMTVQQLMHEQNILVKDT